MRHFRRQAPSESECHGRKGSGRCFRVRRPRGLMSTRCAIPAVNTWGQPGWLSGAEGCRGRAGHTRGSGGELGGLGAGPGASFCSNTKPISGIFVPVERGWWSPPSPIKHLGAVRRVETLPGGAWCLADARRASPLPALLPLLEFESMNIQPT